MKYYFVLILWMCYLPIFSQESKKRCLLLDSLFNSAEVISSFHLNHSKDSLILLHKKNFFSEYCSSFKWNDNFVSIQYDSALVRKLNNSESREYLLFKNNCKVFTSNVTQKGKLYLFSLLQPCSSVQIEALVKMKGSRYKLISLKKYVL
jgi:hypothetical protein